MSAYGLLVPCVVFCVWILTVFVREVQLRGRMHEPSVCRRCRYPVSDEMLNLGRCPECGTPYVCGGIDTPRMRFDLHAQMADPIRTVLMPAVILAIVVSIAFGNTFPRWPEWLAPVVGGMTGLIVASLMYAAIRWNRRPVLKALEIQEAKWVPLSSNRAVDLSMRGELGAHERRHDPGETT